MQWIGSICGRLRLLVFANFEATSTDHMPGSSPGTPCTALVKNRTSHGSLGSWQTTHTCDTSLETAIKMSAIRYMLYTILQQTEKLSTL